MNYYIAVLYTYAVDSDYYRGDEFVPSEFKIVQSCDLDKFIMETSESYAELEPDEFEIFINGRGYGFDTDEDLDNVYMEIDSITKDVISKSKQHKEYQEALAKEIAAEKYRLEQEAKIKHQTQLELEQLARLKLKYEKNK